ncbi:hypothetical protein PFISCL1PPCAC_13735, partial [Pristionchus fissidentatus]
LISHFSQFCVLSRQLSHFYIEIIISPSKSQSNASSIDRPSLPSLHFRLGHFARAVNYEMGAEDASKNDVAPTPPSHVVQVEEEFTEPLLYGMFAATDRAMYVIEKEQKPTPFGSTFIGKRRHDGLTLNINFEKTSEGSGDARLRQEAFVCHVLSHSDPALSAYILTAFDYGLHEPWIFTVSHIFTEPLPDMLKIMKDKEELDRATILKVSTHMFLAIEGLHRAKIIHGNIRPENFVVGARSNNRKILLTDYAHASGASAEFPKAPPLVDLTYSSRGRQREFEPTRKDDLESWLYCVAELYDPALVPWTDPKVVDKMSGSYLKDMLKLKRGFCSGKMWKAMQCIVPEEFKRIIDHQKTLKKYRSPDYSITWHLLVTACNRHEVEPFAYFSWNHCNTGNPVVRSKYDAAPVSLQLADID